MHTWKEFFFDLETHKNFILYGSNYLIYALMLVLHVDWYLNAILFILRDGLLYILFSRKEEGYGLGYWLFHKFMQSVVIFFQGCCMLGFAEGNTGWHMYVCDSFELATLETLTLHWRDMYSGLVCGKPCNRS